jgi:hypothetical protein
MLGAYVVGSGYGPYVFYGCTSLASVSLPSTIARIPPYAFQGCSSLTAITIPSSITQIDAFAFWDCTSLVTVTCLATTPPAVTSDSFAGVPAGMRIKIPTTSHAAYATSWAAYGSLLVDN